MKFNKIIVVALLLLAILTIGAVSASDNLDSDDSSYVSTVDGDVVSDVDDDDDWSDDDDWDDDDDDDDDWDDDDWDDDDDDDDDWDDDDWDDDDDDDEELDDEENVKKNIHVFSDIESENVYFEDGDTIIAYLKNLQPNAVGNFSIYEYDDLLATTLITDKTSFKLSDLNFTSDIVGTHEFIAKYHDGQYVYKKTFYVTFIDYKIIAPTSDVSFGNNAIFSLYLPKDVNGIIEVEEDGEYLGSFDVIDGFAKITLKNLLLGFHEIEFFFDDDSYYMNDVSSVVISPKKVTTVPKSYVGIDNFITVSLPNDAEGILTVAVRNLKTGKITELDYEYSGGKAGMPASKLACGDYAIVDYYIEDYEYGSFFYEDMPNYVEGGIIAKFSVYNPKLTLKTVKVKRSARLLVLNAILGKTNGKYPAKKQIVFKFAGKTFKAKTNAKGVAKVTVKNTILSKLKVGQKIKYQATFSKITVKKVAKVVK